MAEKVTRTVKLTDAEMDEFREAYYLKFAGSAPISDSALIKYMAIRGCEALKADVKTDRRVGSGGRGGN